MISDTLQIFEFGNENNQPLLLLHGFAGSHKYWSNLINQLTSEYYIITPDLYGHGSSKKPTSDIVDINLLCSQLSSDLNIDQYENLYAAGYSMGGRILMHLMLRSPDAFTKTVLISSSAGISDQLLRTERLQSDKDLAKKIESKGIDWFKKYWTSLPLFESRKNSISKVLLNEIWSSQNAKRLSWALSSFSVGSQLFLSDQIKEIKASKLLLAGELDKKYVSEMTSLHENSFGSKLVILPGCGHDIPSEAPLLFQKLLIKFLSS